jgi:hypothetical protein
MAKPSRYWSPLQAHWATILFVHIILSKKRLLALLACLTLLAGCGACIAC